ncbi:rCG42094 [Rattus norvegicus]|uniref:RCG42094 n=1 Tax=Rattus norvegicus TaxID=10116 RepID=A6JUP0_RAT|nr:rCG42094 [Rattus norvegicus]
MHRYSLLVLKAMQESVNSHTSHCGLKFSPGGWPSWLIN